MKPNSNVIPLFVMVTVGGQFAFRLIDIYKEQESDSVT